MNVVRRLLVNFTYSFCNSLFVSWQQERQIHKKSKLNYIPWKPHDYHLQLMKIGHNLNHHLTTLFCNTTNQEGVVTPFELEKKITLNVCFFWYHGMNLFFPYIPKCANNAYVTSQ